MNLDRLVEVSLPHVGHIQPASRCPGWRFSAYWLLRRARGRDSLGKIRTGRRALKHSHHEKVGR